VAFEPSQHPPTFLEIRVKRLDITPGLIGLCVGYEQNVWRERQLAAHLMRWLPEFALKHTEVEDLGAHNALDLVMRAARSVYATDAFQKRGEFGELLLHVALRQCFETIPAVSKYFYKDSRNDTVKGFDAVHVIASPTTLELWLGEVKFYDDIGRAISDVIAELEHHVDRDYLRDEFAAITNKIDDSWSHSAKLKKLLRPEISLDEVFDAVCIPVLLTYDSPVVQEFDQVCDDYKSRFEREIMTHHATFATKASKGKLPERLKIQLFLVPLREKASLVKTLDEALKKVQSIL
jgi:hypothetical protein